MNNTTTTCKACGRPTELGGACRHHPIDPIVIPGVGDITSMHGFTMAILGKPLVECGAEDLAAVNDVVQARARAVEAAYVADRDRLDAAIQEASGCGCERFQAPLDEFGRPDIGRARVVHTCGRSAR